MLADNLRNENCTWKLATSNMQLKKNDNSYLIHILSEINLQLFFILINLISLLSLMPVTP